MSSITVTRLIDAPVDVIFNTVSDIRQFARARKGIVSFEIFSQVKSGVGTRFRETRRVKDKEMTMDFEITEYVPNERVRVLNDTHGTLWDSLFTVKSQQGQTELTLIMDARAYKLLPKIIYPLIRGMVRKSIAEDMDSVKAFCEKAKRSQPWPLIPANTLRAVD